MPALLGARCFKHKSRSVAQVAERAVGNAWAEINQQCRGRDQLRDAGDGTALTRIRFK